MGWVVCCWFRDTWSTAEVFIKSRSQLWTVKSTVNSFTLAPHYPMASVSSTNCLLPVCIAPGGLALTFIPNLYLQLQKKEVSWKRNQVRLFSHLTVHFTNDLLLCTAGVQGKGHRYSGLFRGISQQRGSSYFSSYSHLACYNYSNLIIHASHLWSTNLWFFNWHEWPDVCTFLSRAGHARIPTKYIRQ